MNKKLLICGVIATGLLLTACVKKEPPKEEEQEKVETTAQEQPQQPSEFKSLDSAEAPQDIPAQVQVEREETPHTTTEVRREVSSISTSTQNDTAVQETIKPEPKKEVVKTESVKPKTEKTASTQSSSNNSSSQSEDDAVAAAIAAATPALKN
ncbi:internalin [Acinetobacter sp. WU_MDCI_Axc73]|nr:internalin [Acinetobacter sp. WU_MDCI_Axc73]